MPTHAHTHAQSKGPLPAQSPTGPQPQTHLSKTPWCTPTPPSRTHYRYPPPTPRCESCKAAREGKKTLPLQMRRIKSGTSAPASLLVQRFSGPRCLEKPSSKACWAGMGRDEGAQYRYSRAASPGALLPMSSHDGPLVHRTSPSSTYTWHMGSAASREGLASSSGWYGQPGPDGPTGAR